MSCEYCERDTHALRCPNFVPAKPSEYCDACGEGIYAGEKYIENLNGDFIHSECINTFTTSELIRWLGHKVQTMRED